MSRFRRRLSETEESIVTGNYYYKYPPVYPDYFLQSQKVYYPSLNGRPYWSVNRASDFVHPGPPYEGGGPLEIWAIKDGGFVPMNYGSYESTSAAPYRYKYDGYFICKLTPYDVAANCGDAYPQLLPVALADFGEGMDSTYGNVEAYGATAWNKFKPGKPTADVAQFLAESAEIPRMLATTARSFAKSYKRFLSNRRYRKFDRKQIADEWLNQNFGWRPFISDLRKFHRTWNTMDKSIAQIQRDNGKWVKRGGTVTVGSDFKLDAYRNTRTCAHWPALGAFFAGPTYPNMMISREISQRVWFEGRFRYYIPNIKGVHWRKKAIANLYGAVPRPDLIWELTPFSWLVDWFSNTGDVLANAAGNGWAENLTAKYAYVMGTTESSYTVHSTYPMTGGRTINASWEYSFSRKSRVEANPFGFGLTWDDLSARQWSILAALGVSKLKVLQ